jgi:hypothetical protein
MKCSSWKIYLKPKEVEAFYGIKVSRLAFLRCQGKGPDYYKVGKSVVYRKDELDEYFEERRIRLGNMR